MFDGGFRMNAGAPLLVGRMRMQVAWFSAPWQLRGVPMLRYRGERAVFQLFGPYFARFCLERARSMCTEDRFAWK